MTTELEFSFVVQVMVAEVPAGVAAMVVIVGGVVSVVANDSGAAGDAGEVAVLLAASVEETR